MAGCCYTSTDWLTLFLTSGVNIGSQVNILVASGDITTSVLSGTIVVIGAAGQISYVRLALSVSVGDLPAGSLVTIVADHIVGFAPFTLGSD
jgi:hypothetical protein